MHLAPRCLAKTRRGALCQCPAVRDKKRCRIHGGAKGSGAPKGNKNAFKHGRYGAETIAKKHEIRRLLKEASELVKQLC